MLQAHSIATNISAFPFAFLGSLEDCILEDRTGSCDLWKTRKIKLFCWSAKTQISFCKC